MGTCANWCSYNIIPSYFFVVQALATLKQKIRKYNKDFESGIEAYRQNPVESDEEGEEEGEKDEGNVCVGGGLCTVYV